MNVTFLIGNGFDLGLGLDTQFQDYFPIFCKQMAGREEDEGTSLAHNILSDTENWSDFEIALGEFTKNFTPKTKDDFFNQIESFEEGFFEYLKSQERRIKYNPDIIIPVMEKALLHFFNDNKFLSQEAKTLQELIEKDASQNIIFNFINFNYTSTLENCLDVLPNPIVEPSNPEALNLKWEIGKVVHVHGKRESGSIMGVDNSTQVSNKELAKDSGFIRRFIKPQISQRMRGGLYEETKEVIDNSQIICVYGMSLGTTDKTWWSALATWLNRFSDRRILIFQYDPEFDSQISSKIIKRQDDVANSLLQCSDFNTNIRNQLLRNIYVAIHKNIFAMKLAEETDPV